MIFAKPITRKRAAVLLGECFALSTVIVWQLFDPHVWVSLIAIALAFDIGSTQLRAHWYACDLRATEIRQAKHVRRLAALRDRDRLKAAKELGVYLPENHDGFLAGGETEYVTRRKAEQGKPKP